MAAAHGVAPDDGGGPSVSAPEKQKARPGFPEAGKEKTRAQFPGGRLGNPDDLA